MSSSTRATVHMEEQMAALMEKLEEQSHQIKCLTEKQSVQLEDMERRQQQMEKYVTALMEEQRATRQGSSHGHKQDEELDTQGPSHMWSGYPGPVPAAVQKPMPFDGSVPWDTYKLQFDTIASMNHWGEQDKAAHLLVSLRGPATGVLTSLPPEQRQDYPSLTAALELRFGTKHQVELNRMRLRHRIRRRGEGLPELAEDIERLARLAYPDAPASMIEALAKDQFLDALPEGDLQLKVRQSRPPTLRQALEVSLELESLYLTSKQHSHMAREAILERDSEDEQLDQKAIHHITELVRRAMKEPQQAQRERNSPRHRRTMTCWHCGKRGHMQRECPMKAKSDTRTSQSGNGQ